MGGDGRRRGRPPAHRDTAIAGGRRPLRQRGPALGAQLIYRPVAAELIALSPHPLVGRTVLDAGAGTGAASKTLAAQRAKPIATDLSFGMLAWDAAARPPSAVADIRALPLAALR